MYGSYGLRARDARTGAPDEWAPTGVPTYPRALPTSKKVGKFSWEKPLEINWGNLEYEKLEKHWENWKWGNLPENEKSFLSRGCTVWGFDEHLGTTMNQNQSVLAG